MRVKVFWSNSEIPIEKEKELFLHEIDLGK